MNNSVVLMAVDLRRKRVRVMKNVADVAADASGEGHTERRLGQNFGEVLPLDVLHLDVEEAVVVAVAEDAGNPLINSAEAGLQHGAAAFGLDDFLPIGVRPLVDELESDFLIGLGIEREIDTAHSAERQEFDDPVLAELAWMHAIDRRPSALPFAAGAAE